MEVEEITKYFGKTAKECKGFDLSKLKLPSGEYTAYTEYKKEGYSLAFTDEAMFLKNDTPLRKGELYLSAAFFYKDKVDKYKQYKGKLPFNLDFSMDYKEVVKVLNQEDFKRQRADKKVAMARWDSLASYIVFISFNKEDETINYLQLNVRVD